MTTLTEVKDGADRWERAVCQATQERPFDVARLCPTNTDVLRAHEIIGAESDWCHRCWMAAYHLDRVGVEL